MSREIKFKLWDLVGERMYFPNGEWSFDDEYDSIHFTLNVVGFMSYRTCENAVLLQYTGLKDKNGVEIYEGDIVRVDLVDGKEIFKVYYQTERARFSFEDINGDDWGFSRSNEMKVIGNIYEDPKLIEGID